MALRNELEKGEVLLRSILLHGDIVHQALSSLLAGLISLATVKEGIMIGIQIIDDILSAPHHDDTEVRQEAGALPDTGGGVVAGALLATGMGITVKALHAALVQLKGGRI